MVARVSRIGAISSVSSTAATKISAVKTSSVKTFMTDRVPASYQEKFYFPDEKEIVLKESETELDVNNRQHCELLNILFMKIVTCGIIITPAPPLQSRGAIIEASLVQDPQKIHPPLLKVPLRGVKKQLARHGYKYSELREVVSGYVKRILAATSDKEIVRLIIIIAHEYGHFLSFKAGNHTKWLVTALKIFRSNKFGKFEINQYFKLIFHEEVAAWRFARRVLNELAFIDWTLFDKVKNNSLATYAELLHLNQLSGNAAISLSFLGDDFHKAIRSAVAAVPGMVQK